MEENKERKKCWNCGHYTAYYTKGETCFEKTECGYCSKHKEIKEKRQSCLYWYYCNHATTLRYKTAGRALKDIVEHLSAIRQILQEEEEKNNGQT